MADVRGFDNSPLDVSSHLMLRTATALHPSSHKFALNGLACLDINNVVAIFASAAASFRLFDLPGLLRLARFSNGSRLLCRSVDLFRLVFRLEASASHRINALGVKRVPRPEVILGNLLSLRVELDSGIETTELLVLLTDAKLRHDHDSDEVIQLVL